MKKPRVKRFVWVRGPSSTRLHIKYGTDKSEGMTKCGIPVGKGWWWVAAANAWRRKCKRCMPA